LNRAGRLLLVVLVASLPAGHASAGHELPFYPSFYPQEIRIETVPPAAAGPMLGKGALHAYVGGDPFAGRKIPANIGTSESLASYVVITFNPASPSLGTRDSRCESAAAIIDRFKPPDLYSAHPYPVTPLHGDYLRHFDLAEKQRAALLRGSRKLPSGLHVRARGALAEKLLGQTGKDNGGWDAMVEDVDLGALLASARVGPDLSLGPPWLKQGWFHAYLLEAGAMASGPARRAVDDLYARLTTGAAASLAERVELERRLVSGLTAGCERVVAGYAVRRERFDSEFSEGVENVGRDSQTGFDSAIFIRTVKLKDFPWNGWLRLGIGSRPIAAWNPVGGFGDEAGRLVWAAVGDPAQLPAPNGQGWVANRVNPSVTVGKDMAVPEDALLPEAGTGLPREVGKGKSAGARITYKIVASAFHDNTRMSVADAVYPYLFAARVGSKRPGASESDAGVAAATALARQTLVGFRPLRVDSDVRKYSDITFTFVVPVVDVYVNPLSADANEIAAQAPPWSAVPWHVLALMEEAVKRGIGAFSAEEAKRRGVRWLDLARDARTREALAALVDDFARRAWVPESLKRFVAADEAQQRWTALAQFAKRRGHFLVTNGPYQLERWSDGLVVLGVFRDFSNPLGVGAFDRFAIPRRAYVSKIAARGDRLEVSAEIERVEKFLRDYRLVREPLGKPGSDEDRSDVPACRYVVLGGDGAVAAAGTSRELSGNRLVVDWKGALKPGEYTALVALSLDDNEVAAEIATTQFRVEVGP
jgi:hypothetical protein